MKILRFFFSNIYIRQFVIAGFLLVIFFVGLVFVLKKVTFHNEYYVVPNLEGISMNDIPGYLSDLNLRYEVIDSSKFTTEFPPNSVIDHIPGAGDEVKKHRRIYLTVNPSGFRKVSVPNIIQVTYRNAASTLNAVGFEIGEILYKNNIGKDMVLEIRYDGQTIQPGTALPKTSKLDLVLGNGEE